MKLISSSKFLCFACAVFLVVLVPVPAFAGTSFGEVCPQPFIRGDVDWDGDVDVLDAYFLLNALFVPGSPHPVCDDVADVDDLSGVNFFDAVLLFRYIFLPGEPAPQQPFPNPGFDEQAVVGWIPCDRIDNDQDGLVDEGELCQTWARVFDTGFDDRAFSVQQTSDGGYVIAGQDWGVTIFDGYVAKFSPEGVQEWSKKVGDFGIDTLHSVQQTNDGGYIAAGAKNLLQAYLVKLDNEGNIVWESEFGGDEADVAFSVQQTSDGGYILAGSTESFGPFGEDIYLVKADALGALEWEHTFGNFNLDRAVSVRQTTDGDYIIAAISESLTLGLSDYYLLKVDSVGGFIWDRTFGGDQSDDVSEMQQTSDGGYILAGSTRSFGAEDWDFYLVKTDVDGVIEWQETFGDSGRQIAHAVSQTAEGGYVVSGTTRIGTNPNDASLLKISADGDLQWQRSFGGAERDYAGSVQQTSDGGYVFAGGSRSFGTGNFDIYLVKTSALGEVAECVDLIDNDLDGAIDYPEDLQCLSEDDSNESS